MQHDSRCHLSKGASDCQWERFQLRKNPVCPFNIQNESSSHQTSTLNKQRFPLTRTSVHLFLKSGVTLLSMNILISVLIHSRMESMRHVIKVWPGVGPGWKGWGKGWWFASLWGHFFTDCIRYGQQRNADAESPIISWEYLMADGISSEEYLIQWALNSH